MKVGVSKCLFQIASLSAGGLSLFAGYLERITMALIGLLLSVIFLAVSENFDSFTIRTPFFKGRFKKNRVSRKFGAIPKRRSKREQS